MYKLFSVNACTDTLHMRTYILYTCTYIHLYMHTCRHSCIHMYMHTYNNACIHIAIYVIMLRLMVVSHEVKEEAAINRLVTHTHEYCTGRCSENRKCHN